MHPQYLIAKEVRANNRNSCKEEPYRILVALTKRLLFIRDVSVDPISKVDRNLLSKSDEFLKLYPASQWLYLGVRILRRRFHELEPSYQRRLDEIRREMAKSYLRATSQKIQEIGELLVYGEVTKFRRAFLRRVEISPPQYRQQFGVL